MSYQKEAEQIMGSGPEPGTGKATQLLNEIFGTNWHKVITGADLGSDASLIMSILSVFNIAITIAVAMFIIYLVVLAFVGSAHEGTPLGRRLHGIWTPIRGVLAVTLLAPIPWASNLSIIQGIMLSIFGFSIQFADMATEAGISYIQENQGQVVVSIPPGLTQEGEQMSEVILHNLMIQYHQSHIKDVEGVEHGTKKSLYEPKKSFKEKALEAIRISFWEGTKEGTILGALNFKPSSISDPGYNEVKYNFIPPEPLSEDVMGTIKFKCESMSDYICQARQVEVERLIDNIDRAAEQQINMLSGDGMFRLSKETVRGFIDTYADNMYEHYIKAFQSSEEGMQREMDALLESVKSGGFMMLGSYIWSVTRLNATLQERITTPVDAVDYDSKALEQQVSFDFNQIDTSIYSSTSYLGRSLQTDNNNQSLETRSSSDKEGRQIGQKIIDNISNLFSGSVEKYVTATLSTNPLISLSTFGHVLISISGTLLSALLVISVTPVGIAPSLAFMLLVLPPIFIMGVMLAYYLPALPFLIWSIAVFGWLTMLLEALVAAPIWAAMHAHPDGEGLTSSRASAGYAIFAQVLLRPILMVIGFFFALLLIHTIPYFGEMFLAFFFGLTGDFNVVGPLTAIIGIFMGSVFILILVNKAFSLVYILPDSISKWMGSPGVGVGEQKDVEKSSRTVVAGTTQTTRVGAGSRHASASAAGSYAGATAAKNTKSDEKDFSFGEKS